LTTTSNSITQVGSADNLAKGLIEIDDELIWIDSFNKTNNTLNVHGCSNQPYWSWVPRNYCHHHTLRYAQVTLVSNLPTSINIKKAINDTIHSLYPKLFAVSSTTFTFNASQTTYALPDDAREVLYMSWQTTGPSLEWLPIKRWRFDPLANAATFNTQKTVNIYENIQPGRTIKVWYTTGSRYTWMTTTDDFVDVTGLTRFLPRCYRLWRFISSAFIP
jgi:hypothetical protein